MEQQRTLSVLERGCKSLDLPLSAADELLRLLELKRDGGKLVSRELGQSGQLDKLLHWLLLNTVERDVVEAYTGKIRHTTMATETDERKAEKRVAALNALSSTYDWAPDLNLWLEPGTALGEIMWFNISDADTGRQFEHYFTRQHGLAALQELLADPRYTILEAHKKSALDAPEPAEEQAEGVEEEEATTEEEEEEEEATCNPQEEAYMQFTVKTMTGKKVAINSPANATVLNLKQGILDSEGFPLEDQRLIFGGKQMEDNRKLADYGVRAGVVVHLVLRLRGC